MRVTTPNWVWLPTSNCWDSSRALRKSKQKYQGMQFCTSHSVQNQGYSRFSRLPKVGQEVQEPLVNCSFSRIQCRCTVTTVKNPHLFQRSYSRTAGHPHNSDKHWLLIKDCRITQTVNQKTLCGKKPTPKPPKTSIHWSPSKWKICSNFQ